MRFITHRGQPREYEEAESGLWLFSVSQIRKTCFDSMKNVPPDLLEAARYRGTLVHRFLWMHLAYRGGIIEAPPIVPEIEGYCYSVERWAKRNDVRPLLLEYRSLNRRLGYAGQVDAKVLYGAKQIETLMDGKSGVPTVTDPMQLLLYNEMEHLRSKQLLDVYFQEDGSEAEEVFVDIRKKVTEWPWAMGGLSVLQGQVNHGCR